MRKEVFIKVGSNTNYEDIKRKIGMTLFEIEKTEKLNIFDQVIIKIEVEK